MSYFSGAVDPDDYEDGYRESSPRKSRIKVNLAIFFAVLLALSTTYAANITLNGGQRKEFGQGIYQIKACDQWVGVGLQSGASPYTNYVQTVKLYGFDPRLCVGRIFKIELYNTVKGQLDLYLGSGQTSGTDTHTSLALMDTSTPLASSGYVATGTSPIRSAYDNWAYDAVTLVDKWGRNVGYDDGYAYIDYDYDSGVYKIVLTYPRALVADVTSVTIESAKYN